MRKPADMLCLLPLCPGETRAEQQARTSALADAVFSNADILQCILSGNVGPSTFVACSAVNRTAHALCRSSTALLRNAALFCGGVTKTTLRGLFAISQAEAASLPHDVRHRAGGGVYCLYRAEAVDAVLRCGGMVGLRERLLCRVRAHALANIELPAPAANQTVGQRSRRRRMRSWQLEEALHRRKVHRAYRW